MSVDSVKLNISSATIRNWERLHTDPTGKLTARANKRKSVKRIIPVEYLANPINLTAVREILSLIDSHDWAIEQVIYSLCYNLLKKAGLSEENHVKQILTEFQAEQIVPELADFALPPDEYDIVGLIYQSLLPEGIKNAVGSYYTPQKIASGMTQGFLFSHHEKYLDPCCGSGAFLLSLNGCDPSQIYGVDRDPIAVFIAKTNLLIKYADKKFIPQVFCCDFLQTPSLFDNLPKCEDFMFDYIATNPPWGAASNRACAQDEITSNETFSLFFVKAFRQLKKGGIIRFLFPESVLNVKAHRDLRFFLSTKGALESITSYHSSFTGVTARYVDIAMKNQTAGDFFSYYVNGDVRQVQLADFYETENMVFHLMEPIDLEILRLVKAKGVYDLRDSVWALGIVTGDNKKKLFSEPLPGREAIYTGKEIQPYLLRPAKHYLCYDRSQLQQAAKDEIYRASEKLVYKFISKKLVFAYDNTGSLFLNSANILIPNIPHMSMKTVMAFLNSELYQYLYLKMFGETKILKGNLEQLPFPSISEETNALFCALVNLILSGKGEESGECLQSHIYHIFGLTEKQIIRVRSVLGGKADS